MDFILIPNQAKIVIIQEKSSDRKQAHSCYHGAQLIFNYLQFMIRSLKGFTLGCWRFSSSKKPKPNHQELRKEIQKLKESSKKKFQQLMKQMRNPDDRQKKIYKFCALYLAGVILLYQFKKEKSEQVGLQKLRVIVDHFLTDTITVSKINPKSATYILRFTVNGQQYHYSTANLEQIQVFIQEIQANKTLKTKIIMEIDQPFDEKLKRISRTLIRIFIPMVFPFLLFNSRLGMVFKTSVLNQAETVSKPNVLFKDIAGLGNAKIEVSELVDFLKRPEKYKKIGAKVPKGALLAGPPGTGKTMLAKACAGQANVPFFSVSGSEFVELFAGMGARRVRQLFENAKKQTPAIIFIDEIDAIGKKRQDKFGGANDERANTLNQLLVEMDGFGTSDDIIVLAATNRKEMLDNALTRPGRFDRIVEIELPDLKGRKQILEIYLSKIKLSSEKTLEEYSKRIATLTFGFSGADLANLCNEAAILAVRKQKKYVESSDFESASDRVIAGLQQSTALSEIEKRKVAYHESGHAVTAWFLEGASPLLKITIIPRSKGALGFAQYLPNQSTLATKQDLIDQMCVILGGRISEQIFFNQVSSGASDDLQKVRQLSHAILVSYGMSEKNENYAPTHTDGHNIYSEQTAALIDQETIQLIKTCTQKTREILGKHKDKVAGLAEAVLKKETLNHQEIREILGERPFPSNKNYREFIEQLGTPTKADLII